MLRVIQVIFGTAVAAFLVVPIVAILPLAFTSSIFLNYPIPSASMRWFDELAEEPVWRMSIINSLVIGGAATLVSVVLGTAGALGLRHGRIPLGEAVRTMFLVPMVVPPVVLGVGLQITLVRLGLANSHLGVVVSHAVLCIPFVVVSVSTALAGIDTQVELAAASLGAGPLRTFRRVTFPLAFPGIVTGGVFAFATSLDEVVLTLFVAGPNQRTLARQMFSSIRENISPAIAAAAFLLIVGTLLLAGLVALLRWRERARPGASE
ncbi:putative spermidine/putrescine transport system permease protein [Palleronia aestuarii]|uniref:Putative spermidine/putrescine transport system permease protein n=1 Tax=Palleronia aestuarii TaxID=568105 RepID=A0A2W7N8I0_9RHOB|nr:ABC transporter permease [Palleronia aestuarii]PZX16481.1 putative spermidine/putrescine transport system permease protein [Palleronia aestuarii]